MIENLSVSTSYNMAADSLRWSNINTNMLVKLTKGFNLNLQATWDPYCYQLNEYGNPVRVDVLRSQAGRGWARLASAGTSFSYTFNNDTFKKKKIERHRKRPMRRWPKTPYKTVQLLPRKKSSYAGRKQ